MTVELKEIPPPFFGCKEATEQLKQQSAKSTIPFQSVQCGAAYSDLGFNQAVRHKPRKPHLEVDIWFAFVQPDSYRFQFFLQQGPAGTLHVRTMRLSTGR